MIIIVNYGMGNLGSLFNMFKYIGFESKISDKHDEIIKANKLILPGVGKFDAAMKKIREIGFEDILTEKALKEKIPILGICLGMQLLTNQSEEGALNGLGWIPSRTIKFNFRDNHYKVPHMGWNSVYSTSNNPLIKTLQREPKFYFVHSYFVSVDDEKYSLLKTSYGGITFDSAINKDNVWGTQFHPEKSHKYGIKILQNFAHI